MTACRGAVELSEGEGGPEGGRRPNVLLILVDDLTVDLGAYGQGQVRTPHIDRLAARGARFERAYAQFPLCHPSRTSLLSGRYPEATGVFDNETDPRLALGDAPFLPEHFRRHGYRTARFGKIVHTQHKRSIAWGDPPDSERPPSVDGADGHQEDDGADPGSENETPAVPGLRRLEGNRRAVGWKAVAASEDDLPDGRIARRAVGWLEAHHREPFFLAVGFNKPHPPFVAPRAYFDLYDPASLALAEPSGLPPDLPQAALDFALLDSGMGALQRRRAVAAYYACVSFVDAQVGLLLDAIDRLALWDSTIVVLVSDHGMHLGEHGGLWRKLTLFDEVLRVPLVIAAPGAKTGVAPQAPVELVDLYPTLVELAGLETPPGLQGRSLAPQLREPLAPGRGVAYSVLGLRPETLGRTVRTQRYRYSDWPGESAPVLWDLETDPGLERDLAGDPRYRRVEAALRRLLEERAQAASAPARASQSSR